MKIEFTKDEMVMLTAMVIEKSKDVENGIFDKVDKELAERYKKTYSSLEAKILTARLELMASAFGYTVDAEFVDEED